MKNETGAYSPVPLANWFETHKGAQCMELEQALVDQSISRLFGAHCAVSSVYRNQELVNKIPCRRVYELISPSLQPHFQNQPKTDTSPLQIVAPMNCLPFSNESLDGFILLHTFDFVANPHEAVREAARVIRPGGQIIVIGFNPASLLGLSRYLPGLRHHLPSKARFLARHRLSDWLNLMNFELEYLGGSSLVPFKNFDAGTQTRQEKAQSSAWKVARQGVSKVFRERYGGLYCLRLRKSHMAGTLVGTNKSQRAPLWRPVGVGAAVARQPAASRNSDSPDTPSS